MTMTSKGVGEEMVQEVTNKRAFKQLIASGVVCLCVALGCASGASSAFASYGFSQFDANFANADGSPATQAGSHPYAATTKFTINNPVTEGEPKDIIVEQPTGFVGDTTTIPTCSNEVFFGTEFGCPDDTQVGVTRVVLPLEPYVSPVYNLQPPPGSAAKFGFIIGGVFLTFNVDVKQGGEYNLVASSLNLPTTIRILEVELQLWGVPADPRHDGFRGACATGAHTLTEPAEGCDTELRTPERPFLTLPTACKNPGVVRYETDSWQQPGAFAEGSLFTHNNDEPPAPQSFTGCDRLGLNPTIAAQPTTKATQSPTGLDFGLNVIDEGLKNPAGVAQSDIEKAEVTLPEGFSINPAQAEGLATCTEGDLARETAKSEAGAGCPDASKVGTVEVESPLLAEKVNGSLYVATPYQNETGSLIGLYMVIKNRQRGIMIKQPLKIENDPATGQITGVADDLPQLPFSHFKLHFREGSRSPLASPSLCGEYAAKAVLTPRSGTAPVTTTSAFTIISGPNAGPCPTGGTPPLHPGLEAGTVNNAAGQYSPFYLHLTRNDGEQEITHFSIKLPPGVVGKLAGIPFCPDADIAAATARTGPHGGQEELEHPSCPAASEVGHTLVGAGVGSALTYVPGKVYLAGPYHGSALSIVSITAAKAGPFDLGTVVVREALKVNPESAEVFIDGTGSDPLPHIIKGIPVDLRDIRVYVDRPEFVLNPTSCERTSTASTVLGSGTNFASEADDRPITVTTPFQASSCASLDFKPKLALSLKGGTKRNQNPAFRAVVTARKGDANIGKARVTLPHSEFLDNAHIKTVCTRVQFNAGGGNGEQCPAGSVYGRATATTPILDEPLEGPVFLRSSSHKLPDLVAALHSGKINIDLDGRIDSAKGGRIRNTFEAVPDAPVTKFTLEMFGGKKSLLVNSTNLCKGTHRAISEFTGQNGKAYDTTPALTARCGKKGKRAESKSGSDSAARLIAGAGW